MHTLYMSCCNACLCLYVRARMRLHKPTIGLPIHTLHALYIPHALNRKAQSPLLSMAHLLSQDPPGQNSKLKSGQVEVSWGVKMKMISVQGVCACA